MSVDIHPTAIVAKGAELAEGVSIGPYSIIGEHVRIGARTTLASHVVVEGHTQIGEDCTVVVNGDVSQCDLAQESGLRAIIHLIKSQALPVPVVEFTRDEIVRSGICAMWVRAFDQANL